MDSETLVTIGESSYGERWKAELARTMKITPQYVQDWVKGNRPIPAHRSAEIYKLCVARINLISGLLPDEIREQYGL